MLPTAEGPCAAGFVFLAAEGPCAAGFVFLEAGLVLLARHLLALFVAAPPCALSGGTYLQS